MNKLGIDIGRVIIAPSNGNQDTSFLKGDNDAALATPAMPNALETISQLVSLFENNVWLVSKASPIIQEKTRMWLQYHHFFQITGMSECNIRFCLQRKDKAQICQELSITHFIDDRMAVLEHLRELVPNRYLFGKQKPNFVCPKNVIPVLSWEDVLNILTK